MNCNLPSSFCPCDFPGKNTGVCCRCHFLLQGIFLTQGLNPNFLHWQANKSLPLSHLGSQGRELQSAALIRDCFCCSSMEPFPFRVDSQLAFAWESLTLTLDSVSSLIPLSPYPRVLFFWKSLVKLFCLAWALRDLLLSCQVMSNSLQPHGLSTPGFPVLHYLLEFAQTQVHWNGDAIQLSHSLSSLSPPALNLSQHQGLFQWVGSSHQVAKVLELQHQSFQWVFKFDFL